MRKLGLVNLILMIALALFMPLAQAQRKSENSAAPSAHGNADYITAAQLKDYLTFIASDEMEGRDTPSRGLDTTAGYLVSQLSRWGLKPAGDNGTYFQRIALRREGHSDHSQLRHTRELATPPPSRGGAR